MAAVFLVIITVISNISIFYGVELLFHLWFVEVFLSVFVSLLFGCIYIFLLNTFSKSVKPDGRANLNLSNIIRFGFVLFMAFLISKPIEVWIYRSSLQPAVDEYKHAVMVKYEAKLDSLFENDIRNLQHDIFRHEQQQQLFATQTLAEQITALNNELDALLEKKTGYFSLAQQRIDQSSYLLYQIGLVSKKRQSWVICALIVVLFLLPAYFIYSISGDDVYYQMKKERERRLILQHFNFFVSIYKNIFLQKWNVNTDVYSVFVDPPFNTIRKAHPVGEDQALFLNRFLD